MKVYLSGGSPIAEHALDHPLIMPSYYVCVKNGKPNSRLRKLFRLRRQGKTRDKNECK